MKLLIASLLLIAGAVLWCTWTRNELKKIRSERDDWKRMYCGLAASESIRSHESMEYWEQHEGKVCKQRQAD
jgi:hypothetical protein